jgi:hypothetical protein
MLNNATMQQKDERKRKKKLLFILLCLLLSISMLTGVMFAFFSDQITGNVNATSGTLNLVESATVVKYNGSPLATPGTLPNMNPGDYLSVSVTVTNSGNKSAWLRGGFKLTGDAITVNKNNFPNYFKVYKGDVKPAAFATATLINAQAVTGQDAYNFMEGSAQWTVINGSGNNAEIEYTTGTNPAGTVPAGNPIVSGTTGATLSYTIYFDPSAGNAYQNKKLDMEYAIEAMQYKNNSSPTWTNLETI